jgi:hypothetical protein
VRLVPDSRKDLIVLVARVALATALSGPAGAGQVAGEAVIERVAARLSGPAKSAHQAALDRVTTGLREWAKAEAIPAEVLESGLSAAATALSAHGPQARRIVGLNMDPERVSEEVLRKSDKSDKSDLRDLDEASGQVCRRAVTETYRVLLSDPALLPELERAFEQAVLRRLGEVAASLANNENNENNEKPSALSLPVSTWSRNLQPPSALLRPAYQVVDFEGRATEIGELMAWCADGARLAIRLYTGAGGMGKTRLMMELCRRLKAADGPEWRAGFLTAEPSALPPEWAADLTLAWQPTFVVIDYAETKRQQTLDLLAAALIHRGPKLRCVLLARAAADWWHELKRTTGRVGDLLNGPATTTHRLAPLATDPADRAAIATRAFDRFSAVLTTRHGPPAGPFEDPCFDRVLFLHLAALSAAADEVAEHGSEALLDSALRREQAFWDEGVRAMGAGSLAGRPILQAAAVATLAGRVATPAAAVGLLRHCPLLADQPLAVLDDVAELLHRLYPGAAWLEGVQPDLLGDHLVRQALAEDPGLMTVFDAA